MGLVTFLPDYGIIALTIKGMPTNPILVTCLDLLWTIGLTLVLPISLQLFKWISTAAVMIITTACIYTLYQFAPNVVAAWSYMWIVLIAFVGIGWLLISTPLWRWTKGTLPVVQADNDNHHHQN